MKTSAIINHLGEDRNALLGSVAPPLFQTSNFCFSSVEEMKHALEHEFEESVYTRGKNPTVAALRKKVAALEHTDDCLVFASGCAAVASTVLSLLRSGDHVVSVRKPYTWVGYLFKEMLPRFGINTTMVDGREPGNFLDAVRPETRLIYLESPNSLTMELQDIGAVAAMARERGITTMIDNTYCTPLYQNPADMGIDIVVHSASKYFSGHSDLVAGLVCSNNDIIRKVFVSGSMALGGIISPHDAWLMLRGLRTMPLRLEKSRQNAEKLVEFLEGHPRVDRVIYPFAKKFPQRELAEKQMKGANGLFTVVLKEPGARSIETLCEGLQSFLLAVSWGGYESLVFPMGALGNIDGVPPNAIRVYAGLEEPETLLEDFSQALEDY
jgi:cystathionine beta-lyase/cystathionine gamma-synthase